MDGPITVFGGTGFIGCHLVPLLVRSGATVPGAVRDRSRVQVTTKSDQAVEYIQADLLDDVAVGAAIAGRKALILTPAPTGMGESARTR
jgi:NADH dehydrogenase